MNTLKTDISFVPKFALGRIEVQTSVRKFLSEEEILVALGRHVVGDWGVVGSSLWIVNAFALINGTTVWSEYLSLSGENYYIHTSLACGETVVYSDEDVANYDKELGKKLDRKG